MSISAEEKVCYLREMLTVNVEELNYLAKRLDSFDTGEAAQFQAMAHKLELFELKDLINLTFCCQQATIPIRSCPTPPGRWPASLRTRASPVPRPRSVRTSCG